MEGGDEAKMLMETVMLRRASILPQAQDILLLQVPAYYPRHRTYSSYKYQHTTPGTGHTPATGTSILPQAQEILLLQVPT